jgi:hypothetical protein
MGSDRRARRGYGLTGHPDHVAVSGWVERAWLADGCRALLLQATLTESFHRR